MKWISAEKHCLKLSANLMSVHSQKDYLMAKALIRAFDPVEPPTWLGLSDCQKKNEWFWSDGTKVTFTKWNPTEPNFLNGECCVHMNWGSKWVCDNSYKGIHNENKYRMAKALIRTHDSAENPTWIGLSSCQEKYKWFWSDGTKLIYTKWNPREPNHLLGECCVHMNYGKQRDWNDIRCKKKFPFVCAKKLY
ncbi:lactose-binding lectin l-2-like [Ictalurus furcatus]|uniref:lactose-binding lectin l-2-like n=1 Tax=Ictalurus furcatus TaxID=66913 RepID=UPI00234FD91D|nr:lactose-binding lectin l-2-like [Ictalurus furcatus]